jgi:hypothetical protein
VVNAQSVKNHFLQLFLWWWLHILLCLIIWFSFLRADKISELIEDIRLFYTYNYYVSQVGVPRKYNEWCVQSFFSFAFLSTKLDWIKLLFPAQVAWNFLWIKPSLDRIFGKADDLPKVNVCLRCFLTFYIATFTKIVLWYLFWVREEGFTFWYFSTHYVAWWIRLLLQIQCLYITCVCIHVHMCAHAKRKRRQLQYNFISFYYNSH